MTDRGRLTPPDVVYYAAAIFILSLLAQPLYQVMNDRAGDLGTGEAYLFQMIFPALVLSVLSVIVLTGGSGGSA